MTRGFDKERLVLSGDIDPVTALSVEDYLQRWSGNDRTRAEASRTILAILEGAKRLAARLACGELPGDPGRMAGQNADGDTQKAIDVGAHHLFVDLLIEAGAASILSEEADEPIQGNREGKMAVAIDPLDGSGNVGIGAPLGTIFSLLPATEGGDAFLTAGRNQIAAGYVSYGHTIDLGLSVGNGVILATFFPEHGRFLIVRDTVSLGMRTTDLAFNASVYRHLAPGMRSYVDDCLAGTDGPRGRNFNMRWLGAAVGELHRILRRNGLFFYVGDSRQGYAEGRLRLIYEANPIAFLCLHANGSASDGAQAILDKVPAAYHERTPLIYGSSEEVETLVTYLQKDRL